MWQATTIRRSKNAALVTMPAETRTRTYFRAVADERQSRSLEAQAASIRAFIAIHTDWQLIPRVSADNAAPITADDRTA